MNLSISMKSILVATWAVFACILPSPAGSALADGETPHWDEPSSVVTREWRTADGWLITFIRGEAAKKIFEGLDPSLEQLMERHDHRSAYRFREAAAVSCSFSNLFPNRDRWLCAFATKPDGTTAAVVADPEMGQVARIGVSN